MCDITAYISLHLPSEQQKVWNCRLAQNADKIKNWKHASVQLTYQPCSELFSDCLLSVTHYKERVKKAVMVQIKCCLKTESHSISIVCYIWHKRVDCHLKEVLQQCNLLGMFPFTPFWIEWGVKSWVTRLLVKFGCTKSWETWFHSKPVFTQPAAVPTKRVHHCHSGRRTETIC